MTTNVDKTVQKTEERRWTPEQQTAIDVRDKTLLVSAAAGSGKTAVLTERIIRTLTEGDSPADISELLVVTFTNAAAAEMRERISAAIKRAIANDPTNRHLERQLMLLPGSEEISVVGHIHLSEYVISLVVTSEKLPVKPVASVNVANIPFGSADYYISLGKVF